MQPYLHAATLRHSIQTGYISLSDHPMEFLTYAAPAHVYRMHRILTNMGNDWATVYLCLDFNEWFPVRTSTLLPPSIIERRLTK